MKKKREGGGVAVTVVHYHGVSPKAIYANVHFGLIILHLVHSSK